MIPYNTEMKSLVMPEYGRLVQQMVDICTGLEDRDERNALAATIVNIMKSVVQEKGKTEDDKKYWDHLFLISGYSIDIDSPYGRPSQAELTPKPEKIPYSSSSFNRRHYGHILQKMIRNIAMMENSEEKDMYVELLSNQIKKQLILNNPENANNERVFADLADMSGGNIVLTEEVFPLPEYKTEKAAKNAKHKKNH